MAGLSFEALWEAWTWQPIAGCPGRFRLTGADPRLPVSVLAGVGAPAGVFRVPGARDEVHVVCFAGGGLISYRRRDGTWLHTLNTSAGLSRKLCQLGIGIASF